MLHAICQSWMFNTNKTPLILFICLFTVSAFKPLIANGLLSNLSATIVGGRIDSTSVKYGLGPQPLTLGNLCT